MKLQWAPTSSCAAREPARPDRRGQGDHPRHARPSLAYQPELDTAVRAVALDHTFPKVMTHIVLRRGEYLRRHARALIVIAAS